MLNKSSVIFDENSHTYHLDGVALSGITGMIKSQLFPDKYKDVSEETLNNAKDRGSLIHKLCELVDDIGIKDEREEVKNYIYLKEKYGLECVSSEYLVSDNKHFATCIDKVYKSDDGYDLADIKTTSTLDKEYLSWQLSIDAFLFELQNPGIKVNKLFGIWLKDSNRELVEIKRIPTEVVIELLRCEVEKEQFKNPYKVTLPLPIPEKEVMDIVSNYKHFESIYKAFKDGLMKTMVEHGVYGYEGENVKITRRQDGIRKDFDKERFKADYPELYEQYIKETPLVGTVIVKVS